MSTLRFYFRIFFSVFSPLFFSLFVVCWFLARVYLEQGDSDSFYSMANLSLLLLLMPASTIIHEAGHLIAARLVSAVPRRMTLGTSDEVHRFVLRNFKVVINARPFGGHAIATWPEKTNKHFRVRRAFHVVGGVLANTLVAIVLYTTVELGNPREELRLGMMFMIANALAILNLIPRYTSAWGMKIGTDGMQLWKLMTQRDVSHLVIVDKLYAAVELMEEKKFREASILLRELVKLSPENILMRFNLSTALFKAGHFDEALSILNELTTQANTKKFNFILPLIYNQFAWHYLVMGEGELAMKHAAEAYKLDSRSHVVKSTYASALIETGKANEGIQLLHYDQRFANSHTLSAAIYLMTGFEQRRNKQRAALHRNFVLKHIDKLDLDERMLFERLNPAVVEV